jgi:DNA polymerase III delta prime subunit
MVAQPIVFKKVPMMSIAKRLQDICDEEGLDSDLRTLSMLSETTDGDIRSCLNTLQVKACKIERESERLIDFWVVCKRKEYSIYKRHVGYSWCWYKRYGKIIILSLGRFILRT